jgi:phosphoribosylformimino-5-aminoimidazole carboxamide ribotide isomerase
MRVIPVIDVRQGSAVRAVRGDRANYQLLETPFAAGSDPVSVARGFCAHFPVQSLYIADLDGIEKGMPDLNLIQRIADALPDVALWVDNGASSVPGITTLLNITKTIAVLGSESLRSIEDLRAVLAVARGRLALSFDFRGEQFEGPQAVLRETDLWPDKLIVMTLARVGSGEGPDLTRLADFVQRAGERDVYAAGGVRDRDDLDALAAAGVSGALVATALHVGKIKAGDLVKVTG